MFTSADAIQKDNKDNAAISQDAQRRNAGLAGSATIRTAQQLQNVRLQCQNIRIQCQRRLSKMCCNRGFIWQRIGFCTSACVRRFPQYVLLYV